MVGGENSLTADNHRPLQKRLANKKTPKSCVNQDLGVLLYLFLWYNGCTNRDSPIGNSTKKQEHSHG